MPGEPRRSAPASKGLRRVRDVEQVDDVGPAVERELSKARNVAEDPVPVAVELAPVVGDRFLDADLAGPDDGLGRRRRGHHGQHCCEQSAFHRSRASFIAEFAVPCAAYTL